MTDKALCVFSFYQLTFFDVSLLLFYSSPPSWRCILVLFPCLYVSLSSVLLWCKPHSSVCNYLLCFCRAGILGIHSVLLSKGFDFTLPLIFHLRRLSFLFWTFFFNSLCAVKSTYNELSTWICLLCCLSLNPSLSCLHTLVDLLMTVFIVFWICWYL